MAETWPWTVLASALHAEVPWSSASLYILYMGFVAAFMLQKQSREAVADIWPMEKKRFPLWPVQGGLWTPGLNDSLHAPPLTAAPPPILLLLSGEVWG